jgi:hypothetical protein
MARGWESKSVEEQQAEFTKGASANEDLSEQAKKKTAERRRLQLARVNVSNQLKLAQNPRYIELLTAELAELDRQISALS